ncbi:MAG: hypothetical protein U1E83_08290 [Methylotetracoccus sp.]
MNFKLAIGLTVLIASAAARADLTTEEFLQQKYELLQAFEDTAGSGNHVVERVPLRCFAGQLPRPRRPTYTLVVDDNSAGTSMGLRFWRQPCTNSRGTALMVRATPGRTGAFLCSLSMAIVQSNTRFSNLRLIRQPGDTNGQCGLLFSAETFIVEDFSPVGTSFAVRSAMDIEYTDLGGALHTIKLPNFR